MMATARRTGDVGEDIVEFSGRARILLPCAFEFRIDRSDVYAMR